MNRPCLKVLICSISLALGTASLTAQQAVPYENRLSAFIDVNVVSMESDEVLEDQIVLVRDGVIVAIGDEDELEIPEDAEVVDGFNGYLMPGLTDLHAHLTDEHEFSLWLAHGVTRVQYLNTSEEALSLSTRVARGELLGPSMHMCVGPISTIEDPVVARAEIVRLADIGFDCVKPYGDLSEPAYGAIIDEANARGMRVISHIPRNLTWQQVLTKGPLDLAHAEEFLYSPIQSVADLDMIDSLMVANKNGVVPTLVTYAAITRQAVMADRMVRELSAEPYSPVDQRYWGSERNHYVAAFPPGRIPRMRQLLAFQRRVVKRLIDAGVVVGLGTDAGNTLIIPGRSVHDELDELKRAGLTSYQALRTATADAAQMLGLDGKAGVVSVGANADLVLLLGDPFEDLSNTRLIAGVMVRGQWLSRDELEANVAETRRSFADEERMIAILENSGLNRALDWVLATSEAAGTPVVRVRALNEMAYQLWKLDDQIFNAVKVFEANGLLYPDDWVPHSSLGEVYEALDRHDEALASYRRAVALNPSYVAGISRIEALERGR